MIINIAYLTSLREIGFDESVGREVVDPDSGERYGYRESVVEAITREAQRMPFPFPQFCNLTAIVVDDNEEDFCELMKKSPVWPNLRIPVVNQERFMHPREDSDDFYTEANLDDLLVCIPSEPWRRIKDKARKRQAKAEFEKTIAEVLVERKVDIVVSDSYRNIIGPVLLAAYGRRILNIHPAITKAGDPARLPGATPTRDAYTRAVFGYIIIDDKKGVDLPQGEVVQVRYEGKARTAVKVPKSNMHGITVHVVNAKLDDGPVVYEECYEFNPKGITVERIRQINYTIKRRIVPAAVLAYLYDNSSVLSLIREAKNRMYERELALER